MAYSDGRSQDLKLYPPPESAVTSAHVSGMAAYQKLVVEANADYEGYWGRLACGFVSWKQPFIKVLDESNAPFFKWFDDGILNVSCNCLDRNIEKGLGGKLPKTRSGKIMRRLRRSIAKGEAVLQDTSTLENPGILEQLSTLAR